MSAYESLLHQDGKAVADSFDLKETIPALKALVPVWAGGARLPASPFRETLFGKDFAPRPAEDLQTTVQRLIFARKVAAEQAAGADLAAAVRGIGVAKWQHFLEAAQDRVKVLQMREEYLHLKAQFDAAQAAKAAAPPPGPKPDGSGDRITPVYPVETALGIGAAGVAEGAVGAARSVGGAILRQVMPEISPPSVSSGETGLDIPPPPTPPSNPVAAPQHAGKLTRGQAFPNRRLPRDPGGKPTPDPEAINRAHTQLGTEIGSKGPYPQAREFDENGNHLKDIDFTNHGRPKLHTNPHQHRYIPNPTGGSRATRITGTIEVIMLQLKTIPIHYDDNELVTLSQVVGVLPANNLTWRVLRLWAIGEAPGGASMDSFENAVRVAPEGYPLAWKELLLFASRMEQVWDCLIIATEPKITIDRKTLEDAGFANCIYVIEAFDSSEWTMGAHSVAILKSFSEIVDGKQ